MAAAWTLEQALEQLHARGHNNLDFSGTTSYKNLTTVVFATCTLHHESFSIVAKSALNGVTYCSQCQNSRSRHSSLNAAHRGSLMATKQADFERKSQQVSPDVDVSRAVYVNNTTPVEVSCKKHPEQGTFFMSPAVIYRGANACRACKDQTLSQEHFLTLCHQSGADKLYDLSRAQYRGRKKTVTVACLKHFSIGFFESPVENLYKEKGKTSCPQCQEEKKRQHDKNRSLTQEQFLAKCADSAHPCLVFDQAVYTTAKTPVLLSCRKHPEVGQFAMKPGHIYRGQSHCPLCVKESRDEAGRERALSQEEFIERCQNLADPNLDLSRAYYVNQNTAIELACIKHPEFGVFTMKPGKIFRGQTGCKKCSRMKSEEVAKRQTLTREQFLDRCVNAHENLDLSKAVYTSNKTLVTGITCREHSESGVFSMWPGSIYQGHTKCVPCYVGQSHKEEAVAQFVTSLYTGKIICNDRKAIAPFELDVYLPEISIAIEFNGCYWHSEKQKPVMYHRDKYLACAEKGIQLIQIWEDDWDNRNEIVKALLSHKLGISDARKVYARNTYVCATEKREVADFLDTYHIQGAASASYCIGLRIKQSDELAAVMVLTKTAKERELLLSRYATSAHVIGGFTKLVKHAVLQCHTGNYTGRNGSTVYSLISFSDNEVSDGSLYRNNGWTKAGDVPVSYMYWRGGRSVREHKFNYRLDRFKNDPNLIYKECLTEKELAELNGLSRCYDSGKQKWCLDIPTETLS